MLVRSTSLEETRIEEQEEACWLLVRLMSEPEQRQGEQVSLEGPPGSQVVGGNHLGPTELRRNYSGIFQVQELYAPNT